MDERGLVSELLFGGSIFNFSTMFCPNLKQISSATPQPRLYHVQDIPLYINPRTIISLLFVTYYNFAIIIILCIIIIRRALISNVHWRKSGQSILAVKQPQTTLVID